MQSCKFNNGQCHKTGPYRLLILTRRTPSIVHAKPWTPPCPASRYLVRNYKLSVRCTALAICNTDDHLKTIGRKSGNYEPSAWGDYFATNAPLNQRDQPQEWIEQRIKELKEEVKVMLKSTKNIAELMNLVDTVQRLGIGYHFVNDINDALSHLHDIKPDNDDLQHVALRFRLLRQHGFNVSSDVFCKFKDSDGNFDKNLCKDVRGLLSLYNAGFLAFHGEESILDEAISFASGHLKSMINDLDSPLQRRVLRALKTPLHRMVPRIEAMFYIEEYREENTRNDTLLKLATMDYNLTQRIHLEELKDLSLWWKELDMSENLTYARDRLIENYFWALGVYFEPQYSRARTMVTKYWTMLTVLDDTFDEYGTYEECKLLTDAFQRWDEKAIDCLPIYLRGFYHKFISTVNGFQDELEPSERYRVPYLIQQSKILVDSYMKEVEWHAKSQVPTFMERKKPAIDGNAGSIIVCSPLLGMGEVVTKEAIHCLTRLPDIVLASMEICRYTDEAVSYEREMNAGQGPTSIACYMIEHNVRKDKAALEFEYFTDESWKKMNRAFLRPTNAPVELLDRIANYARVCTAEFLLGFTTSRGLKEIIGLLVLKKIKL